MDETAAVTTAINHYNGIFKFVHSQRARMPFQQARKLLAENKISEAIEKFHECKRISDNDFDVKTIELVIEECQRYVTNLIPDDIQTIQDFNWTELYERRIEKHQEFHDNLPQGIFLLRLSGNRQNGQNCTFVGRKNLSELWLKNLIPEIFCSQIRADMILGLLSDWRLADDRVITYFHPVRRLEKRHVFARIVTELAENPSSVDLIFPFPLLATPSRRELCSPPEGWDVDQTYDHNLSCGEEHIRQVTVDVLREMNLTSHRLYDPACSTGVFLHSLKTAFPSSVTIGQDLSQKMCDVAKARVDQVYCGNALSPKIAPGTADCVFVRFLNSEVVTTNEAGLLLRALLPTVAKEGIMVIFGHTPVLLSADDFKSIDDFRLLRNVAVSKDGNSFFQYYILQRRR